jgi:hypothetical protein
MRAVTAKVYECVPVKLVRLLTNRIFSAARQKGWGGFCNGRLLGLAAMNL